MRGMYSAVGSNNIKQKILGAPLDLFFYFDKERNNENMIDDMKIGTSYEHNASRVYINKREDLERFYKEIGFIQQSKLDDLNLIVQGKQPKVLSTEEVDQNGKTIRGTVNKTVRAKPKPKVKSTPKWVYDEFDDDAEPLPISDLSMTPC